MENEMLNKILEEISKINNKVDSLQIEMNKKFEGIKIELKQLRKDFERHDRGEKMAWEDFEKSIGKEFEELRKIVQRNEIKMDIIGNGLGNISEKYKIAEESEKYQVETNKE